MPQWVQKYGVKDPNKARPKLSFIVVGKRYVTHFLNILGSIINGRQASYQVLPSEWRVRICATLGMCGTSNHSFITTAGRIGVGIAQRDFWPPRVFKVP